MYTGFVSVPNWVNEAIIKSLETGEEIFIENKQYAKEIVNIIKIKKPVVLTLEYPPLGMSFATIGTTIHIGDLNLGNHWTIEFAAPIQGIGSFIFSDGNDGVSVRTIIREGG